MGEELSSRLQLLKVGKKSKPKPKTRRLHVVESEDVLHQLEQTLSMLENLQLTTPRFKIDEHLLADIEKEIEKIKKEQEKDPFGKLDPFEELDPFGSFLPKRLNI